MSLKNILEKAKAKGEAFAAQHNFTIPGQSTTHTPPPPHSAPSGYYPPIQAHRPPTAPPPIPQNRPSYSAIHPYWNPSFSPHVPVSDNFRHQLGDHGWGNNELQNYIADRENSFHDENGCLVLRAISSNGRFTSARLTSHMALARDRGSLVATISPPCASGVWPAFWLLPREPFTWPNDGEIDIMETWNGDAVNHTCLHWGHFNGEDWNKHRVVETPVHNMHSSQHTYEFAWNQPENGIGGKMVWYIDGKVVMKAHVPEGTRRLNDFQVIINVAMGGNVCQGKTPEDGYYDLRIHGLKMCDEPTGGWEKFEHDFHHGPEGHAM
ncbi:1c50dce4-1dfc-4a5d-ab91-b96eb68e1eb7 [Sclerotinia trifoliorum]|uniref:1c50dce4-1dfc-4a5d-ab91-b96eb68e1eb7 n=1 Tax=Sclerotinia trifoliorum TaxID=28548 RepID=A0A8H2VLC7_9HELO|nr:1c50dce4-1dfc-4a5d-ab91-b96eb68e1eb7 [Sclerotinia trifoliorum]